jgi:hypothetical protein
VFTFREGIAGQQDQREDRHVPREARLGGGHHAGVAQNLTRQPDGQTTAQKHVGRRGEFDAHMREPRGVDRRRVEQERRGGVAFDDIDVWPGAIDDFFRDGEQPGIVAVVMAE